MIDNPELVAELREAEAEKTRGRCRTVRASTSGRARNHSPAQSRNRSRHRRRDFGASRPTTEPGSSPPRQFAPQSKLDEDTDALTSAQRRLDQAKLAYEEAVRGFTAEEHQIAEANVGKAAAKVDTIKALVDQLTITAPIASQVYQIPVEEGEVVTPGCRCCRSLTSAILGSAFHCVRI